MGNFTAVYVFDTNVLINNPNVLELLAPDELCVIPGTVIDELGKKRAYANDESIMALHIEQALEKIQQTNNVIIANFEEVTDLDALQEIQGDDYSLAKQILNDDIILTMAIRIRHLNPLFITSDRELLAKADKVGINAMSLRKFMRKNNCC